jgi:hypothetical protein
MANFTYTLGFNWQTPGDSIAANLVANGEVNLAINEDIVANQTDHEIDAAIPVAPKLQAFLLYCDQNVTVKTNNSGAPTDTINLSAGVPFFWIGSGSVPLAGAITKFFVTNTTACTFQVRALFNTSP